MAHATPAAPRLVVRIKLRGDSIMGPGKADLLERIDQLGSISAAARELGMSYRQAWMLIDTLNAAFGRPVIETNQGGRSGGGARLTRLGRRILLGYRAVQQTAEQSTRDDLQAMMKLMAPPAGRARRRG
jgi:molybdate transport system regulatory protein